MVDGHPVLWQTLWSIIGGAVGIGLGVLILHWWWRNHA